MKYFYISLIFIAGVFVGRWSAKDTSDQTKKIESKIELSESNTNVTQKTPLTETKNDLQEIKDLSAIQPAETPNQKSETNRPSKNIRELFKLFMVANEKDDLVEQNKLLAELESLDPKNEKVFQAKVIMLQDGDNWEGAHKVLEDCVSTIPDSVYCLRRLANIRSSTINDKLQYGTKCLKVSNNDPLCLIDVALALNLKGEFAKAKIYFETALNLPQASEGYLKDYILYNYAFALEGLNMNQKAIEALSEACRLNNKSACAKLKN